MNQILESLNDSGILDKDDFEISFQNQEVKPEPVPEKQVFQLNFRSFYPNPNIPLWNLILDKKYVFLIGPASYTLHINRSNLISKFDFITRCNHSIPVLPNHYTAIGNRTDIYYNNLYLDNNRNVLNPHLLQSNKVKIVVGAYPYIHPFAKDIDRFVRRREGGETPFRVMPTPLYQQTQQAIKTRPNTGILALMDMIYSPTDTVYLSGFTFFSTGTTYSSRFGVDQSLHLQEPQRELVRHQACMNPRLVLDLYIREILWKREYEWLKMQWKLLKEGFTFSQLHEVWSPKIDLIKQHIHKTVWTYGKDSVARLYALFDSQWNCLFEIEPFEFHNSFNPLVNMVVYKGQVKVPHWFINWWVIQHTWFQDVVIPYGKTNVDSYLTVPWIYTEASNSANLFENIQRFPRHEFIVRKNYSFLDLLVGMQQAVWIHDESHLKQIFQRRELFG